MHSLHSHQNSHSSWPCFCSSVLHVSFTRSVDSYTWFNITHIDLFLCFGTLDGLLLHIFQGYLDAYELGGVHSSQLNLAKTRGAIPRVGLQQVKSVEENMYIPACLIQPERSAFDSVDSTNDIEISGKARGNRPQGVRTPALKKNMYIYSLSPIDSGGGVPS